jgi:hypothetical protein
MFQISETKNGKRYVHNLHDLKLESGSYCHQITGPELFRELSALGVPGVDSHHGHQELCLIYSRWLLDRKPTEIVRTSWEEKV